MVMVMMGENMCLTNLSQLCVDAAEAGERKVSIDSGDVDDCCHGENDKSVGRQRHGVGGGVCGRDVNSVNGDWIWTGGGAWYNLKSGLHW